jgi:CheY-like chemotaxis protein
MKIETQITILLVEDEPIISMDSVRKIKSFGYNVICAKNGESAVSITSENNDIDLILMDINLGNGIDGTETARRILKIKTIPIIFLSFCLESEFIEKTIDLLHYGLISKDSSNSLLENSIKLALSDFNAKY